MRYLICGLLLTTAAFCLLAGALGIGLGFYFAFSPNNEENAVGSMALVASALLLGLAIASLLSAVTGTPWRDRPRTWQSFTWWGIVAAIMVIPSGLLFGPSGAFHHHIGFGFPWFYMVWNGEDPAPGSFQIVQGYEIGFDPLRFGALLAIWLAVFVWAVTLVRPTRPPSE